MTVSCVIPNDGQLTVTTPGGGPGSTMGPTTLPPGQAATVKCRVPGFQFVNGVRWKVDTSALNSEIRLVCSSNKISPDIFSDRKGDERILFCAEGCKPYQADTFSATYPASIVTREENSPPLVHNNFIPATLACAPGYTPAVGDTGATSVLCAKHPNTRAVAWSSDQVVGCVPGCPDVTRVVVHGLSVDMASPTPGDPPFSPGDEVRFLCESGYSLVGHGTVTCTEERVWSENLPECVPL